MAAVNVVLPWSMCPIVPTLTCGLVRANRSLAIVPPRFQRHTCRAKLARSKGWCKSVCRELLLGVEPRTSSLPRTRSTTELKQQGCHWRLRTPVCKRRQAASGGQAGEGNRTLVACLEGRCSTIELHPQ